MALAQKGSRPIVVDGVHYRWTVRRKPTYTQGLAESGLVFAVQRQDAPEGAVLRVEAPSPRPDHWLGRRASAAIAPRHVVAAIRRALAEGWNPQFPGSAFRLLAPAVSDRDEDEDTRIERTTDLARVNALAERHTDFALHAFDGDTLVMVGSFDLAYYYDVELRFHAVGRIDCPVRFSRPHFVDEGPVPGDAGQRRYAILAEDRRYLLVAESVEVVIGKVYRYDRGAELQAGERIDPAVSGAPSNA